MIDAEFIFNHIVRKISRERPHVARALKAHKGDLMIIADTQRSDEDRIDALRRAGASTIEWALAEPRPTGTSIADRRLLSDIELLHAAWALAHEPHRPNWYQDLALATAHGIGLVIASGLSGEESPGKLDLHIWRACGTRNLPGSCDDALCGLCLVHDQARELILRDERRASEEAWTRGMKVVGGFTLGGLAIAAFVTIVKAVKRA